MSKSNTNVDASAQNPVVNLQAYAGQWVVLDSDKVLDHGPDLAQMVEKARANGIHCPRTLYVEPSRRQRVKLGL